jgi:hypothetical protein
MKCPSCSHSNFDWVEKCGNCGKSIASHKSQDPSKTTSSTDSQDMDYDRVADAFRKIEKDIHEKNTFAGTRVWLNKDKDCYCTIIWKRGKNTTEEELRSLFASHLSQIGLAISNSSTFHAMLGDPYYTDFDGIATRACFVLNRNGDLVKFQ